MHSCARSECLPTRARASALRADLCPRLLLLSLVVRRIAADPAYTVIQKIRLVGLHVSAVITSLLLMFAETKLSICDQYMRALTRHLFVRIFVATV